MDNRLVTIESLVNSTVSISNDEVRVKREWRRKGDKRTIELDKLKIMLYNPGTEYMFRNGILYIDDMNDKIELGLEEADAEEPSILILSNAEKARLMTLAPLSELEEMLGKLCQEQILQLADYAIEKEYTDIEKCEAIKKACGIDIMKAVLLNRQDKE